MQQKATTKVENQACGTIQTQESECVNEEQETSMQKMSVSDPDTGVGD